MLNELPAATFVITHFPLYAPAFAVLFHTTRSPLPRRDHRIQSALRNHKRARDLVQVDHSGEIEEAQIDSRHVEAREIGASQVVQRRALEVDDALEHGASKIGTREIRTCEIRLRQISLP